MVVKERGNSDSGMICLNNQWTWIPVEEFSTEYFPSRAIYGRVILQDILLVDMRIHTSLSQQQIEARGSRQGWRQRGKLESPRKAPVHLMSHLIFRSVPVGSLSLWMCDHHVLGAN